MKTEMQSTPATLLAPTPWRPASPREDESARWECVDGRWISVSLGTGKRVGMALVQNSGVLCEWVDSFEGALALARRWRTD
jgi:hypothetical protein